MKYDISEQYVNEIVTYHLFNNLFYNSPGYFQSNNFWLIKIFDLLKLSLKNQFI